jgi:hypothetical protein
MKPGTLTAPPSGFSGMSVHADCGWCDCVGRGQALAENERVDERFDLECGEQLACAFGKLGLTLARAVLMIDILITPMRVE